MPKNSMNNGEREKEVLRIYNENMQMVKRLRAVKPVI